jgi:hypothetical protein
MSGSRWQNRRERLAVHCPGETGMLSPTTLEMSVTRLDVLNYCKNSWIAFGSALDPFVKIPPPKP